MKAGFKNDDVEHSWTLPTEVGAQKGFQILVSASKGNIDNNIGDIWDSRQVRSNQTSTIQNGGQSVKPDTKYFWKVRIWDQDNRLSDYASPVQLATVVK